MPRFSRLDTLNRIVELGLVPIFHHDDAEVACHTVSACAAGGVTLFEFTNRGDHAISVFESIARHVRAHAPDLILGAGTIVDEATAALYVAHGANFIIGPLFNPAVARFCNRRKIPYIPGCLTMTEISTAEEFGVEIIKLSPAECVDGPAFIRQALAPCPWMRMLATGLTTVSRESVAKWFEAGVTALGIGRELIRKEWIEARNYDAITARTTEVLSWIRGARRK